jgi:alpha-L-rhamnosidase
MYGDVVAWFFKALAGIQADPASPGFEHFYLRPNLVGDLTHVKAEHQTMHGTILSEWERKDGKLQLHIKVPTNTTATLTLPTTDAKSVNEGGKPIAQAEGINAKDASNERPSYELRSGEYHIECAIK